ncbi:hypothetical protein AB4Y45_35480 [Paraburkholderia sp. EG287A]|uniref:hypothetical protein n=1 Tax=Paraburkholderia sp. EG287A TaxID=3237012 RepID=UPI0034D2A713
MAEGFISRVERLHAYPEFAITHAGEQVLVAAKAKEIARRQPHHELGGRLSSWLREQGRITWENIQLTIARPEGGRRAVRPDVFSLATTYDAKRINPCVHEVKVSRADFLSDLAKPEKREGYSAFCEQFFYVAPPGIIERAELPPNCGLLVERSESDFEVVVRPRRREVHLGVHEFMNLLLKPGTFNPLGST